MTRPNDPAAASAAAGTPPDACAACVLAPRRAFLRELLAAGAAALAALAALGLPAEAAAALPIRFVRALGGGAGARAQERAYPVPAADGVAIDRDEGVIIARWENAVYAFSLACPHQNTALRWEDSAHRFQCPKHHSKYRPDGTFISGRATRGMDRFVVRHAGDTVVVALDQLLRQDQDAAAWENALVRL